MKKKLKIFIGTKEIGGYYNGLYEGFKELEIDCDLVAYDFNKWQSSEYKLPKLINFYITCKRKWLNSERKINHIFFNFLLSRVGKNLWAIHAIFKYDQINNVFNKLSGLVFGKIQLRSRKLDLATLSYRDVCL